MEDLAKYNVSTDQLDRILSKFKGKPGELLSILEEVQEANKYRYLPKATLDMISEKTGVPLSQIYSVVTFYSFFNLKPQGDHSVIVCRGTACHTKGSKALLDEMGLVFECGSDFMADGESTYTTPDNKFTIRTVACFGQCALSPVVQLDSAIHSNVTIDTLRKAIDNIRTGG